jgi:hypothetical protein
MLASEQIESEGNFFVGDKIPACSVEDIFFDFGDADAFPTQACGFPCLTLSTPCHDGVKADEEDQIVCGQWVDFSDWLECDVGAVFRVKRVDDVGIAACYGAEIIGIGASIDASWQGWISETQGAGCEE